MKKVIIYTDGACSGNPGPGGWAAIMRYKDFEREISGSEEHTTNNRMELMAAIKALEQIKETCEIDLYTDSEYVHKGITQWVRGWKANGWKGSKKNSIKNVELWERLDSLVEHNKINWHWVKAHAGDEYNERADKLAVKARNHNNKVK